MEDWEQHFAEKSRRRFEKERAERERVRRAAILSVAVVLIGFIAAVIVLAEVF